MSYLDTRELAERLSELEDLAEEAERVSEDGTAENLSADEEAELAELQSLRDDIGSEWDYGATLIPVSMFEEYARELADDIGAIPSDAGWPTYCIDWERAANDLAMDYTEVTYQGTDYYVRS